MDNLDPATLAELERQYVELSRQYQIYYAVAFWVEVRCSLYCSMFISTMRIMLRKRPVETVASRIFLVVSIMIFILATFHNITSISRLIRAYALLLAPPAPFLYFQSYKYWDNYAHLLLTAFLHLARRRPRCERNKWIIVAPTLLLIGSIGESKSRRLRVAQPTVASPQKRQRNNSNLPSFAATTFVNWHWFLHPEAFAPEKITPVLFITFPLNLAQNMLTTSLIAFKIYKQHRDTVRSGLQLSSGLDLMGVIRIIVESAMVYTVETAIIIILFVINHPSVVIVQHALPGSIGIVFCLIAIRTHVARSDSAPRPGASGSGYASDAFFPTWVTDADSPPHSPISPHRRNFHHMGPITVTTVTEQHRVMDSVLSSVSKRERERVRVREISRERGDGETMDVDLDLESVQRSPESVRTYDLKP
ncbi:hypothetical protein DFP72DRAFT_871288 [Ephemerocybe angulata]|uniref:Uncharacterized protein n=1 Tax=Ephemerocybe angulata TaxID=980116 RepID=A0A8H6MGV4_9AGAR|nr:hypothetical protein DFP72DRAFT_871288 [Tulosesus angulatus]